MGKIRVTALGDETQEKEQKKKAEARRLAKASKKAEEKAETQDVSVDSTVAEVEPEKKIKREVKARVHSKRYQDMVRLVEKNKLYSLKDAVSLLKKTSPTKFDGTVEIHLNLSLQALGNKPEYRGSVHLPHGTGKTIRVAIADEALFKKLESGVIDFDVLVAHPSQMAQLAKYARILGPKGLMPNPKTGTVSPEPEKRARELTTGEVNFKTEPNNPVLHMGIGKVSFADTQIIENIRALVLAIGKHKIAKGTLSSTMGPGIKLDLTAL